jgi:hypothetical protein
LERNSFNVAIRICHDSDSGYSILLEGEGDRLRSPKFVVDFYFHDHRHRAAKPTKRANTCLPCKWRDWRFCESDVKLESGQRGDDLCAAGLDVLKLFIIGVYPGQSFRHIVSSLRLI